MNSLDAATVTERKQRLRAAMRQALAGLDSGRRARDSARIRERLEASTAWREQRVVLGFLPLPSEPDLAPLLQAAAATGATVALPRWNPAAQEYEPAAFPVDGGFAIGPFGVPEPPPDHPAIPFERLDLVFVPGLAFDDRGRRLGRGRGFFDRLLARAPGALRWGVAFDLQIVAEVPDEPHDINVHLLVTPELWLPTAPASTRAPS